MRYPSRIPTTFKVLSTLFIVFIALFLCSCEKDSVSPEDKLGGINFDYIYIGQTEGEPAIGGSALSNKVVLLHIYNEVIYYYVGTVNADNNTVSWGSNTEWTESHVSDGSINPSVSVSENNVVAAAFQTCDYQSEPNGQVYAAVGTISGNSINWGGYIYEIDGYYPAISITRDGTYAILIYQTSKNGGSICSRMGSVNAASNSISWGDPINFAAGYLPAIAMNNKDQIIVTFNSWQNNNGLWYMTGTLNRGANSVNWGNTISFNSSQKSTGGSKVGLGDYFDATPCVPAGSEIIAVYPTLGYGNFYSYQFGHLNSDNSIDWGDIGDEGPSMWPPPGLTKAYMGTMIEVYEDGENSTKLYYFVYPM